MLSKIISIRNVGRFSQSASTPNPEFKKHNLVYAPNASGKTTLCAVLRSFSNGETEEIAGRARLGATEDPKIDLLSTTGKATFQNGVWDKTEPLVSVFDGTFVETNVHSGSVVDIENRRALYRIIIGSKGVSLAEREAALNESAKAKQTQIKTAERGLEARCNPISVKDYMALGEDDEIDAKIADKTKLIGSLEVAEEIRSKPLLAKYETVELSSTVLETLRENLESLGDDAETLLNDHLKKHNMEARGQAWLGRGLEYIEDDECPLCGRGELSSLPLIAAYRGLFSEGYQSLKKRTEALKPDHIETVFGSAARTAVSRIFERNVELLSFWEKHCDIVEAPTSAAYAIEALRAVEVRLDQHLEIKMSAISDSAFSDQDSEEVTALVSDANQKIEQVNAQIQSINELITAQKESVGASQLQEEQSALSKLMLQKIRHSGGGKAQCAHYQRLKDEKKVFEDDKKDVRKQLEEHTKQVIEPYESRINFYLTRFNAGFAISKTDHSYAGGMATSSYQLRINDVDIGIGDAKTPGSEPSFKNTLSSGDKSTLALAFFLAHLEREDNQQERIVVFDDPFNSQDAFRRSQTIAQIRIVADRCAQVIVLSHDLGFLKQIWEKCPNDQRMAGQIDYHVSTGSKIRSLDIDDASRGRTAKDRDDLINFVASGSGELRDIIKKMRVVCESHFRSTFPGYFDPADNCGAILTKIREADEDHPAKAKYNDLDEVNSYTNSYHHGEDPDGREEPPLDKTELQGYVERALTLVHAHPG